MDSAFNAISWDDPVVQAALPKYLEATGSDKAKVDYAFNALVPKPAADIDGRQAMMQTWLKARLFSTNQAFPFQFNPYLE